MNDLVKPDRQAALPAVSQALDRLFVEIKRAPTLEALRKLRHDAISIQARLRPVKEIADRAGDCWIEAQFKLGDELKEPKAVGRGGKLAAAIRTLGAGSDVAKGFPLAVPGWNRRRISPPMPISRCATSGCAARVRKIRALGDGACERLRSKLKDQDKPVTPNGLLAEHRAENKHTKSMLSRRPPSPRMAVRCRRDRSALGHAKDRSRVRPNQDAFDYETMSVEQLIEFWRGEIVPKLNPDVHVFMWTTQDFCQLPSSFSTISTFAMC